MKKRILIALLLFLLALGTRLYRLQDVAIYPDEITWMVRAKETALAIKTGNFGYFKTAWWTDKTDTEAIAEPLSVISGFPLIYLGKGQSVVSRNILQDYVAARVPVIFFFAGFMAAFYLFAEKLFGEKAAIVSSVLLVLDPVFAANSRLVMNDIFLSAFIFISLFSYLLIKNAKLSVLLASLFAALGFLTKPLGLAVLPVFLLQIFLYPKKRKNEVITAFKKTTGDEPVDELNADMSSSFRRIPRSKSGEDVIKFFAVSFLTFVFISIFWPASWSNLFFAVPEYILRQAALVSGGINNFFLGHLTDNPPVYYYLFELLVRTPPLILISFAGFLYLFISKRKEAFGKNRLSLLVLAFIFLLAMSLSAKKLGIRYALPLIPFIYLFSGYAIVYFAEKLKKKKYFIYGGITVWFLAVFIYLFPYQNLYYNFLVGGSGGAKRFDLVGICQGTKPAVTYILGCYPEVTQIAGLGCGSSTAAYYYPYHLDQSWENKKVFYVEAYYLQLQKDRSLAEFLKNNPNVRTITEKGVDLAYVYSEPGVKNKCK